jgi:hypothetical protein
MLIFDASSRAECEVRRKRSSTPLQALALLNDPQILEGCRTLAVNLLQKTGGDIDAATSEAFRALTSRKPTAKEHAILMQQYSDELDYFNQDDQRASEFLDIGYKKLSANAPVNQVAAMARVANTILNSTESYYKN